MDPYFYVTASDGRAWVVRRSDSVVMCECTDTSRATAVTDALNASA